MHSNRHLLSCPPTPGSTVIPSCLSTLLHVETQSANYLCYNCPRRHTRTPPNPMAVVFPVTVPHFHLRSICRLFPGKHAGPPSPTFLKISFNVNMDSIRVKGQMTSQKTQDTCQTFFFLVLLGGWLRSLSREQSLYRHSSKRYSPALGRGAPVSLTTQVCPQRKEC